VNISICNIGTHFGPENIGVSNIGKNLYCYVDSVPPSSNFTGPMPIRGIVQTLGQTVAYY